MSDDAREQLCCGRGCVMDEQLVDGLQERIAELERALTALYERLTVDDGPVRLHRGHVVTKAEETTLEWMAEVIDAALHPVAAEDTETGEAR